MTLFFCKIGTPDGRVSVRYCRARNRFELKESLEEEGCCVFTIRRAWLSIAFLTQQRKKAWASERFLLFNQELLALLRSGMPVLEILHSLVHEKDPPRTKAVLAEVCAAVAGGSALSEAFSFHPQFFPSLYIASIASGEKTGDLELAIRRYLHYQKRAAKLRAQLKSAALYPLVLLFVAGVVLLFMIFFVIPNFVEIFADANVPLPLITRVVLGLAGFAGKFWPFVLLGVGLLCWALVRYRSTQAGRLRSDRLVLHLPWAGELLRLSGVVNFCRTTATVLGSGLPLVEAMRLASGVLNNRVLQNGLALVVAAVNEGDSLGHALQRHCVFPTVAVRMISTGEKSGTLETMFDEVAGYYEGVIDHRLQRLAGLAEPLILLFVGLVIGGIVVALYLPIFQMAGTVR